MPRSCTVCGHPERNRIEHELANRVGYRDIARQFGISKDALTRHAASHLPAAVLATRDGEEQERAATLHERLELLYAKATTILAQAEAEGRHNVSLLAIKELRGILEFAAKLAGAMASTEPVVIRLSLSDGTPLQGYDAKGRRHLHAVPPDE